MRVPRLFRLLLTLPLLAWSGWFLRLAWQRHANDWFWATTGPPFLPADMSEYIAEVSLSTDWKTPLLYALLPLAVVGLWSLFRALVTSRSAP
jgi:hypothetical protein